MKSRVLKLLLFCVSVLLALGAMPSAAIAAITFDYDGGSQESITYDHASSLTFDYDSPSTPPGNERQNPNVGTSQLFVTFPEFLAAEATAVASDGLSASVRASFTGGKYSPWVAETDTTLFRAENFGQGSGRFFGLEQPANSLDAEIMYNISKWGNNGTQLGTYVIPAGTRGFIGGVEGGSGMQIFIPNTSGIQLLDRSTLFTSELKFISH